MTGRARRPRGGGESDGTTPRRPRVSSTPTPTVRAAHQAVAQVAQRGRPSAGTTTTSGASTGVPATRRPPGESEQLPPGHTRDADGNVRGPDGRFADDPHRVAVVHDRSSEYPRNYSPRTHDTMAARHTDEGIRQGGVPVDANGKKIPHEQLTWRDEQGRRIPYDDLTYDHRPAVVDHWNGEGRNTSDAARASWYDNPDHLTPMRGSGPDGNFAAGARMRTRYRQDTGPNYSN
jgi:hypothetical protein